MQKKEEKFEKKSEKVVPMDTFEMVDRLVENAQQALKEYMELNQEQVDKIVHAMTLAGLDKHMVLAKMAYEETGRGVMEDKVIKNIFSTEYIWHSIKKQKTVGVIDENEMEGSGCRCYAGDQSDLHHHVQIPDLRQNPQPHHFRVSPVGAEMFGRSGARSA